MYHKELKEELKKVKDKSLYYSNTILKKAREYSIYNKFINVFSYFINILIPSLYLLMYYNFISEKLTIFITWYTLIIISILYSLNIFVFNSNKIHRLYVAANSFYDLHQRSKFLLYKISKTSNVTKYEREISFLFSLYNERRSNFIKEVKRGKTYYQYFYNDHIDNLSTKLKNSSKFKI